MADSGVKKFFKFSCLGCLGLVFISALALVLIGWIGAGRAEFTEARASYAGEGTTVPPRDTAASPDLPAGSGTPPNRVRLIVTGVENVVIRPCEENEGLGVEATYNKKRVDFSETLDRTPDGSWAYTVEMTGSGTDLVRLVERLFTGQDATLDVCLPTGRPIVLEAELKRVGVEAELGGLWLPTIDVELDKAGAFVSFDSPLSEPAELLRVSVDKGGIVLHEAGNASPEVLAVEYRFSGITLDLTGEWKRDARIELGGMAAGVTVLVPRSVRVEGVPDFEPTVGAAPETAVTLFFAPGADFDDISVQRR